jgi:hypothetical protein
VGEGRVAWKERGLFAKFLGGEGAFFSFLADWRRLKVLVEISDSNVVFLCGLVHVCTCQIKHVRTDSHCHATT